MGIDPRYTLLTALKGAPLSCAIALAIHSPMGRDELCAATGYAKDAVSQAMCKLCFYQIAVRVGRYQSWQIAHGAKQLPLILNLPALPAPDGGMGSTGSPCKAEKSPSPGREGGKIAFAQVGKAEKSPSKAEKSPSRLSSSSNRRTNDNDARAFSLSDETAFMLKRYGAGITITDFEQNKHDPGPNAIMEEWAAFKREFGSRTSKNQGLLIWRLRELAAGRRGEQREWA